MQQNPAQQQEQAKPPTNAVYSSELQNHSLLGSFQIIMNYLYNDIKKKPRSFKIGVFTIFLVIGFLSAIQSAFQLAPVIFLKIAEDQVGDQDILLTPLSFENSTSQNSANNGVLNGIRLINSTEIEKACNEIPEISGCSPRWLITGEVQDPLNATGPKLKSYVLFINSTQERSVGLGRRLDKGPIEEDSTMVASTLLRGLKLKEGLQIQLNIDFVKNILQEGQLVNIESVDTNDVNGTVDAASKFVTDMLVQFLDQQIGNNSALSFLNLNTSNNNNNNTAMNISLDQLKDAADSFYNLTKELNQTVMGNFTEASLQDLLNQYNISLNVTGSVIGQLLNATSSSGSNMTDLAQQFKDLVDSLPSDFDGNLNVTDIARQLTPAILDALRFQFELTIQDRVNYPRGKWPEQLGNTIVIDSSTLEQDFLNEISNNLREVLNNNSNPLLQFISSVSTINDTIGQYLFNNVSVEQYALLSEIVVRDRMNIYTDSDKIKSYFTKLSNKLYKVLGKWHPTQPTIPLGMTLQGILMLKLFLDNMISAAIFLLVMLSVLLIYSLMISDVEEKTYEFGMLRALGLQSSDLVLLLLMEGLAFALPGIALGLIMAFHINSVVAEIIFAVGQVVTSYQLHGSAIALGFGLGVFIPLLSNYFPIRRALAKTLRDSLDLYHRATGEISVQVMRLEQLGISFSQFITAVTLIVTGMIAYYLAPYAFVYNNMQMFLAIINMVLILMILGFVLLLNLLQPRFESLLVGCLVWLFRKDAHLRCVVDKNMEGHRRRNAKTALMYSIALAFLIFSGTGFNLQNETITDFMMQSMGADIKVRAPDQNVYLDEKGLREYLEIHKKLFPDDIKDYTFVTYANELYPNMVKIKISPLCYFPARNIKIYGVEKNFLQSVYTSYYQPTEFDSSVDFPKIDSSNDDGGDDRLDAVSGLYWNSHKKSELQGSMDHFKLLSGTEKRDEKKFQILNITNDQEVNVLLPEGLKYEISMDVNTPVLLDFTYTQFRGRTVAMAYMMPNFRFSSYRSVAFFASGLVSMEQYVYMVESYYQQRKNITGETDSILGITDFKNKIPKGSSYGVPKQQLLIKLKRAMTLEEREVLINGLRNYISSNQIMLFDVQDIVSSIKSTLFFIDLFSIIVAIISLILSFFLILVSFISNIKENSWEFGVLRAIGLNKQEITRCYMYEAVALVLASGIIGTVIGIIVAVTLTIQILMFIELPFKFVFPTNIFLVTFIMGLVISVLGSYFAIKEFRDKSISTIIKGLF